LGKATNTKKAPAAEKKTEVKKAAPAKKAPVKAAPAKKTATTAKKASATKKGPTTKKTTTVKRATSKKVSATRLWEMEFADPSAGCEHGDEQGQGSGAQGKENSGEAGEQADEYEKGKSI
jgi:hypothetical protein